MFGYRSILQEQARPAAIRESRRAPWLAVGVVCFGAFMGQLDASIVTITFPAMEHDFSVPVAAVQWVSLIYLLGLVALLAPAGRLGDAVGRKLVYTYGFAVFTVASAACGLAPSLGALVALRLIQAIGAAMLQANSVALVTTSAPKARMRFALGVQAGAQAVGLALGPTLGGLLTTTVGWRAVYWVNVPVGIAAVVAGRYLLPRTRQFSRPEKFDWPGHLAAGDLDQRAAAGALRGVRPEPAGLAGRDARGPRRRGRGGVHPAGGQHQAPADTRVAAPVQAAGARAGRRRVRVLHAVRAAGADPAGPDPRRQRGSHRPAALRPAARLRAGRAVR